MCRKYGGDFVRFVRSQHGVRGLLVPEEYGGLDLDLLFAAAVSQSLGENVAPFSFLGPYVMGPIALSHAIFI